MEDDDEFGDLYTDVLPPLTTSFPAPTQASAAGKPPSSSQPRRMDLNFNSDGETLYRDQSNNSEFNSNAGMDDDSLQGKTLGVLEHGVGRETKKFDLNLGSNSNELDGGGGGRGLEFGARVLEKVDGVKLPPKASIFLGNNEDDIDILVEEEDAKDDDMFGKDNNFMLHSKDNQQLIPGISGTLENQKESNFEEDWDSDESEDDLQIVLNDTQVGMEMMPGMGNDEDGDQMVILADNSDASYHQHSQQMMMNEQEWVGEEGVPGVDGERKEMGSVAMTTGNASQAAVQPKVAYSGHAYHQPFNPQFNSQFKYVRPGAAPMPGPAPGPIPGQVRPPFAMNPLAGRGRGDWRPPGIRGEMPMQKSGYGAPVWGNSAGRGYGSGLDFTLPSHKTIFEIDIDTFEEKPWKLPGIDISDFFNFGLNEETWKDYRKQLEQLRLGTTMQNKIRVYESVRAEQNYDPDLPPELAAAVATQDIPSENVIPRNGDAILTESDSARERQSLPIGRSIPVEIFSGDRLPSADTRRLRMHDADCIIEIFCQRSQDDNDDDMAEQKSVDADDEDVDGADEIDDLQQADPGHGSHDSHAYNGRKSESVSKRAHSKKSLNDYEIVREDRSPEVPVRRQSDDDDDIGESRDARSTKSRGRVESPNSKRNENPVDSRDEESFESGKVAQSSLSSPLSSESDEEKIGIVDELNDKSDDISFDDESEEKTVDGTSKDALVDVKSRHSIKKQKVSSHVRQPSQENDDLKQVSTGNSKPRSGSSKGHHGVDDEGNHDRHPRRAGHMKRPEGDEDYAHRKGRQERQEIGRKHVSVKRAEDFSSRGGGVNHNPSLHRHVKSENEHGKVRESVKEQHRLSRNQLDNGNWRGGNNFQDMGSRPPRDSYDNLRSRNDKMDDFQTKKRKEGVNGDVFHMSHREGGSRRKKERDVDPLQWRRDDDLHYSNEGLFQKERNDQLRERDEWQRREEILSRREREEMRPLMRNEEKVWNISSRRNDDYRGSSKEFYPKDLTRRNDQFKESFLQHRGHEDPYTRLPHDDKRARYERPVNRTDNSRMHENKQREGSRRGKDSESVDRNLSKRNLVEHVSQISQTVNIRGRTELEKGENNGTQPNRLAGKKHKIDASSDDEQQPDSKKGRSKLERWTSNKERDFTTTVSLRNDTRFLPEPSKMVEDKPKPPAVEEKVTPPVDIIPKASDDKHLDTVAKLKKRSERFKLPMPSENKDFITVKKIEIEPLPSVQAEISTAPEIKPERPARKRRWTGN